LRRGVFNAATVLVYIATNATRTLYTGVTNDLERRMYEHHNKLIPGFTSKYNISWLVYYEEMDNIDMAIMREDQRLDESEKDSVD
jgi:putative endonuclease